MNEAEKRLLARVMAKSLSAYLDDMRYELSDEQFEHGVKLLSELIDYGGNPCQIKN